MDKLDNHFLGAGWSFPITFSAGNHQLMVTRYEANINESINTILHTKMGERLMNPQFGSGLHQFVFRQFDSTLKGDIKDTIYNSLLENEPRITVKEVEVDFASPQDGLIEVLIEYEYNQTNTRHNYVFPFHLIEGTNL
ncbi:MAG: GPW/gp25 family protein [Bacteroidetes bacterium]|nr:GPW/gp25 family protein [Bacteroidota bacterium]